MKTLKKSTQKEMIHAWLLAEVNSTRFSDKLARALGRTGHSAKVISKADLSSAKDNKARREILRSYRGNFWNGLKGRKWQLVELNQDDVKNIKYTNDGYWIELSKGTRLVGEAADYINSVTEDPDNLFSRFRDLAADIKSGFNPPPVVLIHHQAADYIEVLEGHLRTTSFVMSEVKDRPLRAYLGSRT
jgi:hypothetical protein